MSLKEIMAADISAVFLNPGEFGEMHSIDGIDLLCVIDEEKTVANPVDGVCLNRRKLFVSRADLGYRPVPDQKINIGGDYFYVVDCIGEDLLEIILEAHRS